MNTNTTIPQRVKDFRALLAYHSLTLKSACEHASLNYDSVRVNLPLGKVAESRMDQLEKSALELSSLVSTQ